MNVWLAIVIDPERIVFPVLAATLYATVPGPVPLGTEVIVIHGTLLTAVHAQPDVVPTAMVPLPAVDPNVEFAGVIV